MTLSWAWYITLLFPQPLEHLPAQRETKYNRQRCHKCPCTYPWGIPQEKEKFWNVPKIVAWLEHIILFIFLLVSVIATCPTSSEILHCMSWREFIFLATFFLPCRLGHRSPGSQVYEWIYANYSISKWRDSPLSCPGPYHPSDSWPLAISIWPKGAASLINILSVLMSLAISRLVAEPLMVHLSDFRQNTDDTSPPHTPSPPPRRSPFGLTFPRGRITTECVSLVETKVKIIIKKGNKNQQQNQKVKFCP